jgi:hypothetical protein
MNTFTAQDIPPTVASICRRKGRDPLSELFVSIDLSVGAAIWQRMEPVELSFHPVTTTTMLDSQPNDFFSSFEIEVVVFRATAHFMILRSCTSFVTLSEINYYTLKSSATYTGGESEWSLQVNQGCTRLERCLLQGIVCQTKEEHGYSQKVQRSVTVMVWTFLSSKTAGKNKVHSPLSLVEDVVPCP